MPLLSGDGSNELRLKLRGSPITAGRLTNCLSLPFPRLYPSGGGDARSGCWRQLMLPDYSPRLNGVLPVTLQGCPMRFSLVAPIPFISLSMHAHTASEII